jgi:large repetitive protein
MVRVPTYLYTIIKSVDKASISAPAALAYTMTLTNTGDGVMTGVAVTDTLAQAGFSTSLPVSGPSGDTGTIGAFEIGETWTYAATYAAGQARIDSGANIVNTVSVTSTQTSPASQTATAMTTVAKNPSMTLVKSADQAGPVPAGRQINYTYLVTNTGNVTIYNVSVGDVHNGNGSFPAPGTETIQTDAAPLGDSTDAGANGHWDVLAPGDSIRFTSLYQVVQADIDLLQ